MSLNPLVLEITSGIAEFSNRVGLKTLMSQYGEVDVCWIPPIWDRDNEVAYVKFKSADSAELAMSAMSQGLVQMHGINLTGRYRMGGPEKSASSVREDEERKGNTSRTYGGGRFTSSRDIMEQMREDRGRGGRERRRDSRRRRSSRSRGRGRRDRSRGRRQRGHRSRSPTRKESPEATVEALVCVTQYLGASQSLGLKLKDKMVVAFEDDTAKEFGWNVGDKVIAVNDTAVDNMNELIREVTSVKRSGNLPIVFKVSRAASDGGGAGAIDGANAVRELIQKS